MILIYGGVMCKVSVIIPYYNSEMTIIRAVDSVTNQTYKDFGIILIDDGSTDESHRLIDNYINNHAKFKFVHIYEENSGPSRARNIGVIRAKGEYIAFLDSDDSWHKNKLEIQMKFLENNKDIAILGCDHNILIDNLSIKKSKDTETFIKVNFYKRLFRNYFSTPSVVIKKEVFDELGGFNESQSYAEDTLLFIRVFRKYNGGKIEKPLVNLYKEEYGATGLSSNLKESEKWELHNFKILRQENKFNDKKINLPLYAIICLFSLLKYLRRLAIVKFRKR
jgi:glycosyltransferase involved in cell wall biosynthesis